MGIKTSKRISNVGEYYFSGKLREIRESGKDVINLAIGSPDLPPPNEVVEELNSVSSSPDVHSYQSYQGIPELREAYSKWYENHFQVYLDPNKNILPLMGSKEGIMHITMTFIDHDDEVLIPNPGYPAYESVTLLAGGVSVKYDLNPENNWLPDLKGLAKRDLSRVKIMWVNYPHMPTGANANPKFFQELIQFGKDNDILIVNDNPYSFILNNSPLSLLKYDDDFSHVLELNSLSKSFNMAGWRVGMVAGSEEHLKSILIFKSNMDSGMFLPVQKAAIKALQIEDTWYNDLNTIYEDRRKIASKLLDLLGCTYSDDQSGMFIWARIPDQWKSGKELSEWLLEITDVFIAPGFIFGDNGNDFIRISLCNSEENYNRAFKRIEEKLLVK